MELADAAGGIGSASLAWILGTAGMAPTYGPQTSKSTAYDDAMDGLAAGAGIPVEPREGGKKDLTYETLQAVPKTDEELRSQRAYDEVAPKVPLSALPVDKWYQRLGRDLETQNKIEMKEMSPEGLAKLARDRQEMLIQDFNFYTPKTKAGQELTHDFGELWDKNISGPIRTAAEFYFPDSPNAKFMAEIGGEIFAGALMGKAGKAAKTGTVGTKSKHFGSIYRQSKRLRSIDKRIRTLRKNTKNPKRAEKLIQELQQERRKIEPHFRRAAENARRALKENPDLYHGKIRQYIRRFRGKIKEGKDPHAAMQESLDAMGVKFEDIFGEMDVEQAMTAVKRETEPLKGPEAWAADADHWYDPSKDYRPGQTPDEIRQQSAARRQRAQPKPQETSIPQDTSRPELEAYRERIEAQRQRVKARTIELELTKAHTKKDVAQLAREAKADPDIDWLVIDGKKFAAEKGVIVKAERAWKKAQKEDLPDAPIDEPKPIEEPVRPDVVEEAVEPTPEPVGAAPVEGNVFDISNPEHRRKVMEQSQVHPNDYPYLEKIMQETPDYVDKPQVKAMIEKAGFEVPKKKASTLEALGDLLKSDPNTLGSLGGNIEITKRFEDFFRSLGLGKQPKAKTLLSRLRKAGIPKDVLEATGWEGILEAAKQNELVDVEALWEVGRGSLDVRPERLGEKGEVSPVYGPNSSFSNWTVSEDMIPGSYRENLYQVEPIGGMRRDSLTKELEALQERRRPILDRLEELRDQLGDSPEKYSEHGRLLEENLRLHHRMSEIDNKIRDLRPYREEHWVRSSSTGENVAGHIRWDKKKDPTSNTRTAFLEELQPKWYEEVRAGKPVPKPPYQKQHTDIMLRDFVQRAVKDPEIKEIAWAGPGVQMKRGVPKAVAEHYYGEKGVIAKFFKKEFNQKPKVEKTPEAEILAETIDEIFDLTELDTVLDQFDVEVNELAYKLSVPVTDKMRKLSSVFSKNLKPLIDLLKSDPNALGSNLGNLKLFEAVAKDAESQGISIRKLLMQRDVTRQQAIKTEREIKALLGRYKTETGETVHAAGFERWKGEVVKNADNPKPDVKKSMLDVIFNGTKKWKGKRESVVRGIVRNFTPNERNAETFFGKKGPELITVPVRHARAAETIEGQMLKARTKRIHKELKAKARQRVGAYAISVQKRGSEILAKQGVDRPPKWEDLSPKEQTAYTELRKIFDELGPRLNEDARIPSGLEPIKLLEDYFPFMIDALKLNENQFKIVMKDLSPLKLTIDPDPMASVKQAKLTRPAFVRRRTGSAHNVATDSQRIADMYIEKALHYIHITPVVAQLNQLLGQFKGSTLPIPTKPTLSKKGKPIETMWSISDHSPEAHAWLSKYLEDISFNRDRETFGPRTDKAIKYLNQNVVSAIMGGSIRTMMLQPFQLLSTFSYLDADAVALGAWDVFNPQAWESTIRNSEQLKLRKPSYDAAMMSFEEGYANRALNAQRQIGKLAMSHIAVVDYMSSWIAARSAYHYIHKQMRKGKLPQLNKHEVWERVDQIVERTQGSGERYARAPIQQSVGGKTLTLFQTFAIAHSNFLLRDIVGAPFKEGMTKAERVKALTKPIKYGIGMYYMNRVFSDILGMNDPIPDPVGKAVEAYQETGEWLTTFEEFGVEFASLLPILASVRYGSSVAGALLDNVQKLMSPEKENIIREIIESPDPAAALEAIITNPQSEAALTLGGFVGINQLEKSYGQYLKGKDWWNVFTGEDASDYEGYYGGRRGKGGDGYTIR